MPPLTLGPGEPLLACPTCDLLYAEVPVPEGGRLRCGRCRTVLMTNRAGAMDRTLAAAFASIILLIAALFFPFLELSIAGVTRKASLLDAALAFANTLVAPLSIGTTLLIIILPIIRALALAYTLLPLRLGGPPADGAKRAFRIAADLRPWAMAEVFIIGVIVALVKIAGLASVTLGPAFWAMTALVLLVVIEGVSLDEWSIWQTLERWDRP